MYTGLMDSARQAGAKLQGVMQTVVWALLLSELIRASRAVVSMFSSPSHPSHMTLTQASSTAETGPPSRVSPSVVKKIRDVGAEPCGALRNGFSVSAHSWAVAISVVFPQP